MLTIQEIKSKLTLDDVKKLVSLLGGDIHDDSSDRETIYNTICHGGHSNKLYLYSENKNFHCYSECGNIDILEIVCNVKEYNIPESINWICTQLNWSTLQYGFGTADRIDDWDFINSLKSRRGKKDKDKSKEDLEIKVYDESILNIFQPWYLKDWINEGISIESMMKFEVAYSSLNQQIVLPHRNNDGQLIGVRVRNTQEEYVTEHGKYTPFRFGNEMYNHSLGNNLYGIHLNREVIKKNRKVMLVESEKSVMQCDTMFESNNFSLALCGGNFTNQQRDMIIQMGIRECVIATDKSFLKVGDAEYIKWIKYIEDKFIKKLYPYVIVTVLIDTDGLLEYKMSPTDLGLDTLMKLMNNKVYV